MKNILIISGHPQRSPSSANQLILDILCYLNGVTISDIQRNYTDGDINVAAEQKKLLEADLIIFQFPFIWYGMPSHMKAWVEQVLSYGFAFGPWGNKLKDKIMFLSITLGGSRKAYSTYGQHLNPVETFLIPLALFANYCSMQYLPPVYSYEMAASANNSIRVIKN